MSGTEVLGLWGLGLYCSVMTTSLLIQTCACILAGAFAAFDASYFRRKSSVPLALVAFLLPLVIPTAEPGHERPGFSIATGVAYISICSLVSLIAFCIRWSPSEDGGPEVHVKVESPLQKRRAASPRMHPERNVSSTVPADEARGLKDSAADGGDSDERETRGQSRLLPTSAQASETVSRRPVARRRRPMTASQRVASELYASQQAEKKRYAEAAAARAAAIADEEKRKQEERDSALAQRNTMLAAIQACAQEVQNARAELTAAMEEVKETGQARARAAEQVRVSTTPSNLEELERCTGAAAEASLKEETLLDNLKSVQARMADLQKQLSMMPSIPYFVGE